MQIVLVAAVAENGVIGRDNGLPWRLKGDLQRFRALTWGKPMVMGRKTYLSIGKPLPGRAMIVVSRDPTFGAAGVVVAGSVKAALETAHAEALRRGVDEIIIAGGAEIYRQTIAIADRLEITRVHASPPGDAVFPPIEAGEWRSVGGDDPPDALHDSENFSFATYRRLART